uniref:hypothetical protein n=1 Tax=Pricia sp. TaxID=2268138 RepID=UPI003593F081
FDNISDVVALFLYNKATIMEKIYSENLEKGKNITARPETVQFLLGFSKSLHIVKYENLRFENNLN